MDNIAVLANGPSLKEYWDTSGIKDYDYVIGCNTAAWFYRVDIWCVLDPDLIAASFPETEMSNNNPIAHKTPFYKGEIPVPGKIATYRQNPSLDLLPDADIINLPWYGKSRQCILDREERKAAMPNLGLTFPNALALAAKLAQHDQVDIYGMDITTDRDTGGYHGDRSQKRWREELPWTKAVWQNHWRIFGRAPDTIRDYLTGKTDWQTLDNHLRSFSGGKTRD